MNGFPSPSPWTAIQSDLTRPNRRQVVAVVSYVGRDAPAVMPLKAGDWLVCDASEGAIRQQLTSVRALVAFRRKKVLIFSVQGLHAKVIASPTSAWVGSTNASKNSAERLIEAAVKVTGSQARQVRSWAESLATEDREVTAADLKRLSAIKLLPMRLGPQKDVIPTAVPRNLDSLVLIETGERLTKKELADVNEDRASAQSTARAQGLPSRLASVYLYLPTSVRTGDWVIDIRNGHVKRPAYVVRTKKSRGHVIFWLSEADTKSRPSVAQLRDEIGQLESGFGELRLRGRSAVRKVLNLYR